MQEKVTISNKWRNKVEIKHLFSKETTPELVNMLCRHLIAQLSKIKDKEDRGTTNPICQDDRFYIINELDMLISNFEFLEDLASGGIEEYEWPEYCFDGDFEEMFNGYLSELYDLGDKRVMTVDNVNEKFIWIE